MDKKKKDKCQTLIYKTLYRKQEITQHEAHKKIGDKH